MLEFIQLLKQQYQAVTTVPKTTDGTVKHYQTVIESLSLAESFILKGQLIQSSPKHPLQISVIGPTQAGKSSVTNLLMQNTLAGVSPLAGYTVHPQGYRIGIKEKQCEWVERYFSPFIQVQESPQVRGEYQCFSLHQQNNSNSAILPSCILWDTPDFDSIDAADYQQGVLRTVALADIVVLVLSKEKYADQSVWDIMKMIAPLNQPTIIILNKLSEQTQPVLINSLQEKWRQTRKDSFPEVLSLFYQPGGQIQDWPEQELKKAARLFKTAEKISNRRKHIDYEQQLLKSNWQLWMQPVRAEHESLKEWQQILQSATQDALKQYERDYLNHPHHYETFQNALAELLTLLEIPGIAGVLAQTRKVITWPVKKLYQLSKGQVSNLSDNSQEVRLLNQLGEHWLIAVSEKMLDKIDVNNDNNSWWKELNQVLRLCRSEMQTNFQLLVKEYHTGFQSDVEQAAQGLYLKLQEQPVTLNSLRATRVTTDAAAVALALKTGGIGLHDLIITPAMLSVTSLLTESAIGSYMTRVEAELKRKQLQMVKQQLFEMQLQNRLLSLPEKMKNNARFNISEQKMLEMEKQLTEKRHGLRIF